MRQTNRIFHRLLEPFQPSNAGTYDASELKSELISRLRWCAVFAQIAVLYPAMRFEYLLADRVPAYLATVFALALFNLFALRLKSQAGLFLQLSTDLLALSALLILTAGCHNPFSSLLFISAIAGPMFLNVRWTLIYLLLAALSLMTVCAFTEPMLLNANGHEASPLVTVGIKIVVMLVLGAMTLWLKACLDQAQDRYQQLYRQRQRLNNFRAVGVVAGQLSHELSTPLNTMKILLDRMGRHAGLGEERDFQMASAALNQCTDTVRRLFEEKVDADALNFRETQIVSFVNEICEKWRMDFPDTRFSFSTDPLAKSLACRIPTHPFAQAVMDILDNAQEASDPHSADISIAVQTKGDAVNISISDRGRGFDESVKERLGEPFLSNKSRGTGLGLYNASALLEALGGMLNIKARDGGGTTVSLVIPL